MRYHLLGARYAQALEYGENLSEMARTKESRLMMVAGYRVRGAASFYCGEPLAALEALSNVIDSGMTDDERAEALKFDVVDLKVAALGYTSWAHWQLGHADKARRVSDEAIATAKQTGHPFSTAFAICFASWTHAFCGDLHRALELAEEAYALSRRHGFQFWIGWTEVMSAWSRAHLTKAYDAELEKLSAGIAGWKDTRSRLGLSYFLYLQADLLAANAEHDKALRILDEAKCFCEETHEHFWLPELLRLRGEILFAKSPENASESDALFKSAVAVAQDSGLVALQFRALTSLTRLQHKMHGSSDAARHLEKLLPGLRDGGLSSDQEEALLLLETILTGSHAGDHR